MKKQKRIFAFLIIMTFAIWNISACTPARRPIPNNTRINYTENRGTMPYTGQNAPGNQYGQYSPNVGSNTQPGMTGQTSSLFSKLDYSFATITDNINMRSGTSGSSAIAGNLKAGDTVKVIGKLNGWYIVNVPNTNKVGSISPNYAKLYSAQPGTTTPSPTKPIPTEKTNTTSPTGTTTTPAAPSGTTTGVNAPSTPTGTGTLSAQGSRILQLANAERAKVGAKPLTANTDLTKLANMKSQDIVEKNYFSHQSPTYGSPFDMMKTYGIQYMYAGENLAINSDADKAHTAWMNSEGHRKNILNPDFTEIGIGLYPKGDGSYAYTQMFIGK